MRNQWFVHKVFPRQKMERRNSIGMNVLVIADEESLSLWDYFEQSKLDNIDLIISCGDLSPYYLSFLATMFKGPVLYVHGNHDEIYDKSPPEGCICIEDDIFCYRGIRILGLGGSMKYRDGKYMYTEKQMKKRVRRLRGKIRKNEGFDILITHAPAKGLNDGDDLAHQGFECFHTLLKRYAPRYFIHGHMHMNYGAFIKRIIKYDRTEVVNAFEKYIITI